MKLLIISLQPLLSSVPASVLPQNWGGLNKLQAGVATAATGGQPVEKNGICMGGKVPLYYQSIHKPQEIPGE